MYPCFASARSRLNRLAVVGCWLDQGGCTGAFVPYIELCCCRACSAELLWLQSVKAICSFFWYFFHLLQEGFTLQEKQLVSLLLSRWPDAATVKQRDEGRVELLLSSVDRVTESQKGNKAIQIQLFARKGGEGAVQRAQVPVYGSSAPARSHAKSKQTNPGAT